MNKVFSAAGIRLVPFAPLLLAYLAGVVLSLVFWRRYPRPALLTFLGAVLPLASQVLHTLLDECLMEMATNAPDGVTIPTFTDLRQSAYILAQAVGFGLMLAAAFVGRKAPQQAMPIQSSD